MMVRLAAIASCAVCSWACGLLGPTCLARQERGSGQTVFGRVEPGQTVSHLVRYETSGSQNDANLHWDGMRTADGPRLSFYATRAACIDFDPATATDACAVLARAGSLASGNVAATLIVTHGRGNPPVLGEVAEYKIWVVGDARQAAHYTIAITWFFGPDC
jgi:hypothetical protein